jgi:prevent-host-death family protein
MAFEIPVTQARAEFADLVNRVVYGGERVVVTRHGKPIVALVPAADLERLDGLDQQAHDDQEQQATVVRLSTDAAGQSIGFEPPAGRPLRIAARHRPAGGDPTR